MTSSVEANQECPGQSETSVARIDPNECGFSNQNSTTLTMTGSDTDGKDVLLNALIDCRVMLRGAPSTVHMNNLTNCVVLCGPTSGSVFIDDCVRCTFVVACQQLRVHRTTETSFYLHVTSRAIIEDCSTVTFAPYSWHYATINDDFRKAGLDMERNNWSCIDDFNWLAASSPSPNWTVLDVGRRISYSADGSVESTAS